MATVDGMEAYDVVAGPQYRQLARQYETLRAAAIALLESPEAQAGPTDGFPLAEWHRLVQAVRYRGIKGTDQCSCDVDINAPYPRCPHDIRGPRGIEGPTGGMCLEVELETAQRHIRGLCNELGIEPSEVAGFLGEDKAEA